MRTLKFIVSGQEIKPSPDCDFSGIVKGTKGYLQIEFLFDKEWDGLLKIAEFRKFASSKAVPVPVRGNKCIVPDNIALLDSFKLKVVGKRGSFRITTSNAEVKQIE